MKRTLLEIAALSLLLTAIDQLYRWLHPEVNLVRATLVGLTAFAALGAFAQFGERRIPARRGALAIFASAFLSVLAIEAGALVSRSPASAAVHLGILAVTYAALTSSPATTASASGGSAGTSPANSTRTTVPLA
jgi:hypothetical protein